MTTVTLKNQLLNQVMGSELPRRIIPGMPLGGLLQENRWKSASDPKDKGFALLGLSDISDSPHPGLVIDSNPNIQQVYTGVVHAIVETTSNLNVLCCSSPQASHTISNNTS
jgi:hypothetical protein